MDNVEGPLKPETVEVSSKTKLLELLGNCNAQLQTYGKLTVSGVGNATQKVVSLVELMKAEQPEIHQITELTSEAAIEPDKPQHGKKPKTTSRLTITLSLAPLDAAHPGYQHA
mmetsp:Transcript_26273/g.46983  ORF Transcript_26273/g.46983 Transcript_26273/m.46983 type:complete len:113 (+) Transcript_26273:6324-6662(+)